MAKLKARIPEQNFEIVGQQIAAVLALEIANQFTRFNHDPELNANVYQERFVPFDKTEIPAINVCLSTGKYDNKDQEQRDGKYEYYIDCYTRAKTVLDADKKVAERGDTRATKRLQKIIGMVCAILENPAYRTLGFDAPLIERVWVSDLAIPSPTTDGNTENEVHGRVVFNVQVPETVELAEPVLVAGLDTQVTLYDTDKGYLWGLPGNMNFIEEDDNNTETPVAYFIAEDNTAFMGTLVKFSELGDAAQVDALSAFVGIQDNGDGTFTNYLFSPAELAAFINAGATKKRITVGTAGNTLTDSWFADHTIMEIVTNGQSYQVDEDFTQSGNVISGVTISFYVGQRLIAKI